MDINEQIRQALGHEKVADIDRFIGEMLHGRGMTSFAHNQLTIKPISDNLCEAISRATGGRIDVFGKKYALEASKLYHEMKSHRNPELETSRGQIAYTEDNIYEIIMAMLNPDIIESVSNGDSLDQRRVFAVTKQSDKCVILVMSVGGKRNPNVTPQQIVYFTMEKWNSMTDKDMTIREILYGDNRKRRGTPEEIDEIKRNRVTVAHCES